MMDRLSGVYVCVSSPEDESGAFEAIVAGRCKSAAEDASDVIIRHKGCLGESFQ
ncbi:hypothetical protein TcasGA2_TC011077 [Tribolium castaneum]|uniref:Uncharacterized protein n=1 Tax=Tribolium castaneum TaxID=7070 RepID=D6X4F7_TRICA|nr:hypothetical protein TcasGA2_TC011077 [Tribolium castaneum]